MIHPWLLPVGGLMVIAGLAMHVPKDAFMPPEDDEEEDRSIDEC
jgi:hypothetical protein